jgi:sRNA-binding regulator protein Hfq
VQRARNKRSKKPNWVEPVDALKKWQKTFAVFMMNGAVCQLVIVDLNDPIGIMLQRPCKISRDEGVITGVFVLNGDKLKGKFAQKPYYVVAVYDPPAKAFVYKIEGNLLPMVLGNKYMHFIVGEDRVRVRKQLRCLDE